MHNNEALRNHLGWEDAIVLVIYTGFSSIDQYIEENKPGIETLII